MDPIERAIYRELSTCRFESSGMYLGTQVKHWR
jgi:hypothetical protein